MNERENFATMLKSLLNKSFLFHLFSEARFSYAKKYLIKSFFHDLDPYMSFVGAKDRRSSLSIWAIKQIKHRKTHLHDDLYLWDFNGESWVGNLHHIHGLYEYLSGFFLRDYGCDYKDKTVLDIGGYIGDTARFFLKQGAKRIKIYEPVPINVVCMKHNLIDSLDAIDIVPKAVAAEDRELTIQSCKPQGHIGFGYADPSTSNNHVLKVEAESFQTILSHVTADIAKIDCEGAEKHLLRVDPSFLRKIPYWIIEIHDFQLVKDFDEKFLNEGFCKVATHLCAGGVPICHYSL